MVTLYDRPWEEAGIVVTRELSTFGDWLRRRRQAAGLTQEQLAERAGLSVRGIQDLERGVRRAPHPETVRRLQGALEDVAADDSNLIYLAPALPATHGSFIGREQAVTAVLAALGQARLVSLTGTGGMGKTRLSLEVARRFTDATVWLVELAALADGELVVPAIAAAFGIREQRFQPLLETLVEALGDRSALVVLDNCEHVLEPTAAAVDALLRGCPNVRVLATSREPLRTAGETVWRVPPLPVAEAEALFFERAGALAPELVVGQRERAAVHAICQRLDGVPLAIELAAARIGSLSIDEIAAGLDDAVRLLTSGRPEAPARHQALRATIDWSLGLLAEPERVLLERLSIFAGGWSLDAAEEVVSFDPLEPTDVLDLLGGLVDKSLVLSEPASDGSMRYRLQEVVRQVGRDRISEAGALASLRDRHAAYFLALIETAEPRAVRSERRAWLDRMETEMDNIRAARRCFVERGEAEHAQRLNSSLARMLFYRGYVNEFRAALVEALGIPGGTPHTRARVLHFLGSLAYAQADYPPSIEYHQQSLALYRDLNDQVGLAWALGGLGATTTLQAEFGMAREFLELATAAARRGGEPYILALDLALAGHCAYLQGDLGAAHGYIEEVLDEPAFRGFVPPTCSALATLGHVSYLEGDRGAAADALQAQIEQARAGDEVYLFVRGLLGLALLALDADDNEQARSVLAEALQQAQDLGNPHRIAQVLESVAMFAVHAGDAAAALRFVGAAAAMRETVGAPLTPSERRMLDPRLDVARGALSRAATATAIADGKAWWLERAAAAALQFLSGE